VVPPASAVEKGRIGYRTPRPPLLPSIRFAVLALAAEIAVMHGLGSLDREGRLVAILLPAAHLLLLPFLFRNFALWGIRLITVGLVLNLSVMALNGGLMPVDHAAIEAVGRHDVQRLKPGDYVPGTKNVYQPRAQTRVDELSDAIILPIPRPFTRAVSPGDLFVILGVATVSVELLLRHRRSQRGRDGGREAQSGPEVSGNLDPRLTSYAPRSG